MKPTPHFYKLSLTQDEIRMLHWLTDRGYFPHQVLAHMRPDREFEHEEDEVIHSIPEFAAWSILDMVNDDRHGYLTCLNTDSPLYEKITKLEQEIV